MYNSTPKTNPQKREVTEVRKVIRTHLINGGEADARLFSRGSRRPNQEVSKEDTSGEANKEPREKSKQMPDDVYEMGSSTKSNCLITFVSFVAHGGKLA